MTKRQESKCKRLRAANYVPWLLCAALMMKFFFDKFDFTSGGAMGSLTLGLVIKELWARGFPSFASREGAASGLYCGSQYARIGQ